MRAYCFRFLTYLTAALPVAALADENDILIVQDASDPQRIVTGEVDAISGALNLPVRIFDEALTTLSGLDQATGDEGFFAVTNAGSLPPGYGVLPGLTDVRFDFKAVQIGSQVANLWYWDVNASPGTVDFQPVAGDVQLSFRKSPVSFFTATVDGAALDVPGFVIDRTSSAGQLHKHLSLLLDDLDSDPGTPLPARIYLVAYTLGLSNGAESELVIELFNADLGAAGEPLIEMARDFVADWLSGGECTGDLDGNEVVDLSDLAVLLAHFGMTSGAEPADGDLDGDGDVDLADLAVLLAVFGTVCA